MRTGSRSHSTGAHQRRRGAILDRIERRLARRLADETRDDVMEERVDVLAQVQAEAAATWRSPQGGNPTVRGIERLRAWCVTSPSRSLHAGVVIADHDREALDRLCRYGARPAGAGISPQALRKHPGTAPTSGALRGRVRAGEPAALAKTGRVVVVDEATPRCGIASDVAALCVDRGFDMLAAPVKRVTTPHAPVPNGKLLEDLYMPSAAKIVAAVREQRGRRSQLALVQNTKG